MRKLECITHKKMRLFRQEKRSVTYTSPVNYAKSILPKSTPEYILKVLKNVLRSTKKILFTNC